ncbi:DUF2922 domain-containing protein [Peribacillus loiseleuriae]|uniref:DUF2922 domain-containing protein n=1 Tax=Peribacillus loiseleuriae TaxID=1679170 RepID=A0A0K9GW82_9BACI|nr:DUF2922 domain-containing protein [Peribacillus loiseleuriae]KMY50954.1 hypothetical protein AC625_16645 [Peribacillus loiseleuriae]
MAKTLELLFLTEGGKSATLSITDPIEPVDVGKVKTAMDEMIASNVFTTASGSFINAKGARVVERHIDEYAVH